MAKEARLYDVPIQINSTEGSLTSQVYNILLKEINKDRWQIGERLPGVSYLAKESGISRWAFQRAYERLRSAGYLRQEKGSGSFLISKNPRSRVAVGTIGILMPLKSDPVNAGLAGFAHLHLDLLMEVAEERGYELEIKYLKPDQDHRDICRIGGFFDSNVQGIIALAAFPHSRDEDLILGEGDIPFVHWGSNTSTCLPVVGVDTHNAFYRLTRKVLGLGHERIVFIGEPEMSERESENRYLGHKKAMDEAGLEANDEARNRSLELGEEDLKGLKSYLEKYIDVTAIITARQTLAKSIVSVLELLGKNIPEDVSVIGNIPENMTINGDQPMTRLVYHSKSEIEACFSLLEEQIIHRKALTCRVLLSPSLSQGCSLIQNHFQSVKSASI